MTPEVFILLVNMLLDISNLRRCGYKLQLTIKVNEYEGFSQKFIYFLQQSKAQIKGKINLQTLIFVHIVTMWVRPGFNMGKSIWDACMGPIWVLYGQTHIQFYMGFLYGTHMGPMLVF